MGIDEAAAHIYGPAGLEYFREIATYEPQLGSEGWIRILEANPTPNDTGWFREPNVLITGEVLMPKLAEEGTPVRIASIGSSYGHEAFSLAAAALSAGVTNFTIKGYDVNPEAVEIANDSNRRYPGPALKRIPDRFARYFDVSKDGLLPGPEIRERVHFEQMDLIDQPVAGEFDVIILNNVLQHYPDNTRVKILRRVVDAILPSGYLTLEALPQTMQGSPAHRISFRPYWMWRQERMLQEFPELEQIQVNYDKQDFFRKKVSP